MATQGLTPDEVSWFDRSRSRVKDAYLIGKQQNTHQQSVLGNTYGRQRRNLLDQFSQFRNKLPYNFAARGMMNSGVYQRALTDYGRERSAALGNLQGEYQDQLAGLRLAGRQLETTRTRSLADLDAQRTARIATVADLLRGAM